MLTLVLIILLVSLLSVLWYFTDRDENLPPGPRGIPILGYFPFMNVRRPEVSLTELRKKYGGIMTVPFGAQKVVVISDCKIFKEVYSNTMASDKYDAFRDNLFEEVGESCGIVFTSGEKWKRLRKLLVRSLHKFGVRPCHFDDLIGNEVDKFLCHLDSIQGQPLKTNELFLIPLLNILWRVVVGQEFTYKDDYIVDIHELVHETQAALVPLTILTMLPRVLYHLIPLPLLGYNCINKSKKWFRSYSEKMFASEESYRSLDMPANILSEFLKELNFQTQEFAKYEFQWLLTDLFAASSDTSNATMGFIIYRLIEHKDMQSRIRQEILTKIGDSGPILCTDMKDLSYTEAFISEAQRTGTITPLSTMHKTSGTIEAGGYNLPKNTIVTANLDAIHMDENYWEKPEEFNPDRFINENGEYIKNKESFFPFSYGKRRCVGEELAKVELFLIVARLLQKFVIEEVPGETLPPLKRSLSLIVRPKPFRFIARKI